MANHLASLLRTLRMPEPADSVHFHIDADGRHFVCDVHDCESPGADPARD